MITQDLIDAVTSAGNSVILTSADLKSAWLAKAQSDRAVAEATADAAKAANDLHEAVVRVSDGAATATITNTANDIQSDYAGGSGMTSGPLASVAGDHGAASVAAMVTISATKVAQDAAVAALAAVTTDNTAKTSAWVLAYSAFHTAAASLSDALSTLNGSNSG